MLSYLSANISTVIILLAVIGIAALAVRKLIRDKKAGKSCSGCGGGCSGCSGSSACERDPERGHDPQGL